MTKTDIAQAAHEINRAFCTSIGDTSQPSWQDAQEWQKKSAEYRVQFHLDNPAASPSASHENWLKEKAADGWKYGPVKNSETKEHPCFVPYDQLPVEQRSKDYLFKQVVESLKPLLSEDFTAGEMIILQELDQKIIDKENEVNQLNKHILDLKAQLENPAENKPEETAKAEVTPTNSRARSSKSSLNPGRQG